MSKLTDVQKKMIAKQANKPKTTKVKCLMCENFLTDVNIFFGKKTCGSCEPLYLLPQQKNTWQPSPEDEFLNEMNNI